MAGFINYGGEGGRHYSGTHRGGGPQRWKLPPDWSGHDVAVILMVAVFVLGSVAIFVIRYYDDQHEVAPSAPVDGGAQP